MSSSTAERSRRWRASPKGREWAARPEVRERQREHTRKWHAKNQEATRASRERGHRKRKEVHGRVCQSCGRCDKDAYWSSHSEYCAACSKRAESNGWCPCGSARYRPLGPKRQKPYCKDCREIPVPAGRWTTLLDCMHVAETRNVVTFKDVMRVTGAQKDSAQVWLARNRKKIAEMVPVVEVEGGIGFDFGVLHSKIEG